MSATKLAEQVWYADHHILSIFLVPFSWIYRVIVAGRKFVYGCGLIQINRFDVPVIVIGNITIGGTGKTPLTVWLVNYLKARGLKPGVVSRGYGVKSCAPRQVRSDSNPFLVGDEPVLIARRTGCPVVVAANRVDAVSILIEHCDINIVISDDGLQHLSLYRDLQIAVIDGDRRFGNGHCLPAGPLREPSSSLEEVDLIVSNGKAGKGEHLMEYDHELLRSLNDPRRSLDIKYLYGQVVHAVAGIGNPARFISSLRCGGVQVIEHIFPDHHPYVRSDLEFGDELPVVMTEKDAVKCSGFVNDRCWYLPVQARLADTFVLQLDQYLVKIHAEQETA